MGERMVPPTVLLLFLKEACGLQGALHTPAPRACAYCMRVISFPLAKPPGWIWLRNKDRPMPVNVKFVPFFERAVPELVVKNMSARFVVQVNPVKADEAPKPSI